MLNPLSQQIFKRTGTDLQQNGLRNSTRTNSFSLSSRRNSAAVIDTTQKDVKTMILPNDTLSTIHTSGSSIVTGGNSTTTTLTTNSSTLQSPPTSGRTSISTFESPRQKPKHNQRNFLSKLIRSKPSQSEDDEDDKDNGKDRDEGWKAGVFGYVPNYPTRPKYIWVRAHRKKNREFNRLFFAQELHCGTASLDTASKASLDSGSKKPTTWCAQFSLDGKYLATAGADRVVRIWQVISTPEEREVVNSDIAGEDDESCSFRSRRNSMRRSRNGKVYAPVFLPFPVKEYYGHTADILDLSWSKNNFLMSSSMDKTVRLWHLKRSESIAAFLHPDFVTSIAFHPEDDRFFLSGSLDCKLRLWSITEKKITYEARAPDLIMAVAFTPNGHTAIAGCFGGQCLFFETKGLICHNQMVVKSNHGKNSNGSKITGIEAISMPSRYRKRDSSDNCKLLISTNDSRVRLYDFSERAIQAKFKGHENSEGLIRASFSDTGVYAISGSEDDRTYIWRVENAYGDASKTREDYEYFHSNRSMVTVALFAPNSSRKLLYESRDPIYDIADPPPVILQRPSEDGLQKENVSNAAIPSSNYKVNQFDGNIIITADQDGNIRVFRQDSAYERRKQWAESANLIQKKKIGGLTLSPTPSLVPAISMRGISPASRNSRRSDGRGNSMLVPVDNNSLSAHNTPTLSPSLNNMGRSRSTSSISSWGSSSPRNISVNNGTRNPQQLNVPTLELNENIFDPEDIVCKSCGGNDFRARASRTTGAVVLVCTK